MRGLMYKIVTAGVLICVLLLSLNTNRGLVSERHADRPLDLRCCLASQRMVAVQVEGPVRS